MKTIDNLKTVLCIVALMVVTISFAQEEDMRKADMADKEMMDKAITKVGGTAMYPDKNIVENAMNVEDLSTLVAALKAAGLVETLQGEGPFTVFAPNNTAFTKLPEGTVDMLLKEENKDKLASVLTYHVVAGKIMAKDVLEAIAAGEGKAELTTVNGATLVAKLDGTSVQLIDATGNVSLVTIPDVEQSNGVVHIVDTVVMPSAGE